jgi:hypothetical protein
VGGYSFFYSGFFCSPTGFLNPNFGTGLLSAAGGWKVVFFYSSTFGYSF